MQQLRAEVTVTVPPEYVLVAKAEYEELSEQTLTGVYWNMSDLKKRINKSDKWIKENILYPTRFREKLDARKGGPVYYPESQGQSWTFQAKEMAEFLDKNFHRIFGGE